MIRPGQVKSVRELTDRVQAEVCLGADPVLGSAVVRFESKSPKVMAALAALKDALREETMATLDGVLEGQRRWDEERAG